VITEFEGKKVEEPNQLRNMVANTPPGKEVKVTIIRENKTETKKVFISELPADMRRPSRDDYNNLLNGVSVQDITPDIADKLGIPAKIKGVIVTNVDEDSPAAAILLQGDVIQEINRQKITGMKEYGKVVAGIAAEKDLLLLVFRGGASIFITLSNK
jgi:serine protease Do